MTTIPLPRYEAHPAEDHYPAYVKHTFRDSNGNICHWFPVECYDTTHNANEVVAICAVALAAHYGGVVDTSRVTVFPRGTKGKRK